MLYMLDNVYMCYIYATCFYMSIHMLICIHRALLQSGLSAIPDNELAKPNANFKGCALVKGFSNVYDYLNM